MKKMLLALLAFGMATAVAQEGDVTNAADPCMAKQGNYYYVFSTGRNLPIRRSEDLVHWKLIGNVFDTLPAWAQKELPGVASVWAPDISFYNGKYHLYYSLSRLGKRDSAIGLATNKTLDPADPQYRWVDEGMVLRSQKSYDWNAIDPALVMDEHNRPWLAWGSYWSGIKMAQVDPATGKLSSRNTKRYDIASRVKLKPPAIEGAIIVRKNGYFYLLVSFDGGENYKVMVGRSRTVTGPYVDRQGKPMMDSGGTLLIARHGQILGPGHNGLLLDGAHDWFVHHFRFNNPAAQGRGSRDLQVRPLQWAEDGWPLVGEPEWVPAWTKFDPKSKPPSPVGAWELAVNYETLTNSTFLPDGAINDAKSGATWSLKGWFLTLRLPKQGGGHDIYSCIVSPDGKGLIGRNQSDVLIGGKKRD